jgi:ribosomal protein L17
MTKVAQLHSSEEEPATEVALSDDQLAGIKAADNWVHQAMAELGAAFLEHEEAEQRAQKTRRALEQLSTRARETELQRAQVLRAIAENMGLSPGEWTYDDKQGKLVQRG